MKYKTLGRTGIQVSQLCYGTMSFGGDADEASSAAMYKACRDAGLAYLRGVVEDAKASGLVARAIEKTGARGVAVAPPVK